MINLIVLLLGGIVVVLLFAVVHLLNSTRYIYTCLEAQTEVIGKQSEEVKAIGRAVISMNELRRLKEGVAEEAEGYGQPHPTKQPKADAAVSISNEIAKRLGSAKSKPDDFVLNIGEFAIVIATRLLPAYGWIRIYEITKIGNMAPGYSGSDNPNWVIVEGTRTVNLPPESITNEVLKGLEAREL